MYGDRQATMMVLADRPADQHVINALLSSAEALGHATGCSVCTLAEAGDLANFIFDADPWSVVAIDDASIDALKGAFGAEADGFAPGYPVQVSGGYTLVAVPGFAQCLDDDDAKRVAWNRLKAAKHPGNPLG